MLHQERAWVLFVFWGNRYYLPLAMRATMAWEVPHRLAGALSLAMTPNRAIGPYEENPNTAPRARIHSCQSKLKSETGSVNLTTVS